jgi:hypothetical protein
LIRLARRTEKSTPALAGSSHASPLGRFDRPAADKMEKADD